MTDEERADNGTATTRGHRIAHPGGAERRGVERRGERDEAGTRAACEETEQALADRDRRERRRAIADQGVGERAAGYRAGQNRENPETAQQQPRRARPDQ